MPPDRRLGRAPWSCATQPIAYRWARNLGFYAAREPDSLGRDFDRPSSTAPRRRDGRMGSTSLPSHPAPTFARPCPSVDASSISRTFRLSSIAVNGLLMKHRPCSRTPWRKIEWSV